MHVYVDALGRHVQVEETDSVPTGHHQPAIRFLEGMAHRAIPKPAAVHEQILQLGVPFVAFGVGDEALQFHGTGAAVHLVKRILHLLAEEEADAVGQGRGGGHFPDHLAVMLEDKVRGGVGEGEARERFRDMAEFGAVPLEELLAGGDVVEEVSHFDARADGAAPWFDRGKRTAFGAELVTVRIPVRPRLHQHLRHPGDRSERFAAEAHRVNVEQVLDGAELARRILGECKRHILGGDAAAIIDDADQFGIDVI